MLSQKCTISLIMSSNISSKFNFKAQAHLTETSKKKKNRVKRHAKVKKQKNTTMYSKNPSQKSF